jgi:hypothetical protein
MSPNMVRLTSAAFTAVALDPKQPRPLFVRHDEKKLAGFVMAKGDESGPLIVRLQPAGTVTGRLVDEDGRPRSGGVRINVSYGKGQFGRRYFFTFLTPAPGDDGRFRVEGLIPGVAYDLGVRTADTLFDFDRPAKDLKLQPGETRDLGDVRAQSR